MILITQPLVSVDTLARELAGAEAEAATASLLLIDCSFDLADPGAGRRAYAAGHVPGAAYVHLDEVLSAAKTGRNGRHPLPERAAFAASMAALGANDDSRIVAYDNAGGMYAARLWWMLRWAGHAQAAVLDGGLGAWKAAGQALSTDLVAARPGNFSLRPALVDAVSYADVLANIGSAARRVVDARAPDRFRG
jgi:thiosulfate/3-mercaptopyruvate sulfurtransferase